MDLLIDTILDFFITYHRDPKKAGKGWLMKFFCFASLVAAILSARGSGTVSTAFAIFFGAVAVVLFVRLIRHEDRCIDEWTGREPKE